MQHYTTSIPGRLMALSFASMLSAGATSVLLGAPLALSVSAILTFVAVVLSVMSIILGIADFPRFTVLTLIVLPVVTLLYVVGVGAVLPSVPAVAYLFLLLATAALIVALRPAHEEHPRFYSTKEAHAH